VLRSVCHFGLAVVISDIRLVFGL